MLGYLIRLCSGVGHIAPGRSIKRQLQGGLQQQAYHHSRTQELVSFWWLANALWWTVMIKSVDRRQNQEVETWSRISLVTDCGCKVAQLSW